MGRVVETLTEALNRGAAIDWGDPRKPTIKGVHPTLAARLREDRDLLRKVLHRAAIFREQAATFIQKGQALPVLALPEHQEDDGCVSCGAQLERRCFRCHICTLAVNLALQGKP